MSTDRVVTVAVVQMNCSKDQSKNLEKAEKFILEAATKGAQIICLSELFSCGYFLEDMQQKASASVTVIERLQKLAKEKNVLIFFGIPHKEGVKIYNSLVLLGPKGALQEYKKINLFPGHPISEKDVFSKGSSPGVFKISDYSVGVLICFDLRFPELARELAINGAEILFVPSAWPKKRINHWNILLSARAIENQAFVVGCNHCGEEDSLELGGNSKIIDPSGNTLVSLSDEEGVIIANLDLMQVTDTRKKFQFHGLR